MKRLWWGVPAIAVLIGVLTAVGILSASGPKDEVKSQNPEVTIPVLSLDQNSNRSYKAPVSKLVLTSQP